MSAEPALQRLTRRTWLLWVAVCAVIPVLNAVLETAIGKNVLRTDPNAAQIKNLLWLTMIVTILLPRVLEWAVLRTIAPRLWLIEWYGAAIISGMAWLACMLTVERYPLLRSFNQLQTDPTRDFANYAFKARADGTFTLVEFLSLP